MWRESPRPHRRGGRGLIPRAAVAGMTMLAFLGAFTGSLVWAADPDFSSVSDILGGKTYLLRQDDLVFTSIKSRRASIKPPPRSCTRPIRPWPSRRRCRGELPAAG